MKLKVIHPVRLGPVERRIISGQPFRMADLIAVQEVTSAPPPAVVARRTVERWRRAGWIAPVECRGTVRYWALTDEGRAELKSSIDRSLATG